MADSESALNTSSPATSPKKSKSAKAKKPRASPNHPKISEMVNSSITNLKERGGSSLQAIKKHIAAHYKVDVEKLAPFIKKYLKTAVTNGTLIQTKGKGASGSFKLSTSAKKEKPVKAEKPTVVKRVKKVPATKKRVAEKKVAKPKRVSEIKKKPAATAAKKVKKVKKTPVKAKKPKTPKKEKKAKTPKKPKSPKPKKAAKKAVKK